MHPAQAIGDLVELGDDLVRGTEPGAQVQRQMTRKLTVAPTQQQLVNAVLAAIAVDAHHDVDVIEERRERRRLRRIEV